MEAAGGATLGVGEGWAGSQLTGPGRLCPFPGSPEGVAEHVCP